mmetsp:Transcript_5777/g.18528  ORF Transcript_5777/g.18528 Transcript_5777/m.18528 type:complete len:332 (-) Transcript_5777:1182-2177(-)
MHIAQSSLGGLLSTWTNRSMARGVGLGIRTVLVLLRGHVQARVAVEEAGRVQHEAGGHARLHGPVLRPRDVVEAEVAPGHDVRVGDRPVGLRPAGQAVLAQGLVHELAAGVALLALVGRDPEVVVEDLHPLARLALRPGQGLHGVHRLELVGGWPAIPVLHVRVHKLPEALGLVVAAADRPLLRREHGLLEVEGVAQGVAGGAHRVAHRVALHHAVGVAVHVHVELGAEHVLVDLAPDAGGHRRPVLLALRLPAGGVDDARGLHLELDDAVHHEVPVARVLVVAHGVHCRDHQPAGAADLGRATEIRVLPEQAGVLLVDANRVLDAPRLAA